MINDFQVECFLAVVKHHSFSEAAKEKYLSQPSISKHVKNLEENLGGALFDRYNNKFELTDFGLAIYQYFSNSTKELHRLQSLYLDDQKQQTEKVHMHLGFLQASNYFKYIEKPLKDFPIDYPYFTLDVSYHSFTDLFRMISDVKCDSAICPSEYFPRGIKNLHTTKLFSLQKCIYYHRSLFPAKQPTCLQDFVGNTFVIAGEFEKKKAKQDFLDRHGFNFIPPFKYVKDVDNMVWSIRFNNCVGIMDPSVDLLENDPNIGSVKLSSETEIIIAWSENNENPNLSSFIDLFKAVCATELPAL